MRQTINGIQCFVTEGVAIGNVDTTLQNAFSIGENVQISLGDDNGKYRGVVKEFSQNSVQVTLVDRCARLSGVLSGVVVHIIKISNEGLFILDSELQTATFAPQQTLVLKHNNCWRRVQRRNDVRADALIEVSDARLIASHLKVDVEGMVVNISAGGLLFHMRGDIPIAPKYELSLMLHLPDNQPPLPVRVNVIRIEEAPR